MQNALALNGAAEYHGWHLHGHSFWLVGQGNGTFDPATDPANYNLVNPVFRDTVALLPYGWTAVRFLADNPGAWPMHCVITPHAVMGMGFTVVTSPDLLADPPDGLNGCQEATSLTPYCKADSATCNVTLSYECCYGWDCKNSTCQQCGTYSDPCQKAADCCSGFACSKNKCKYCTFAKGKCKDTSECCTGLICSNKKCTPCQTKKKACHHNSECCSGKCKKQKCK